MENLFKAGDLVKIIKPTPPYPPEWPDTWDEYIFGWYEATWDKHHNQIVEIVSYEEYGECPAYRVRSESAMLGGVWPAQCLVKASPLAKAGEPCDCDWMLVYRFGCQKGHV